MFINELVSQVKVTTGCRLHRPAQAGGEPSRPNSTSISSAMKISTIPNVRLVALMAALAILSPGVSSAAGIPEPSLVLYGKVFNKFNGATTRLTQGQMIWTFKPLSGGAWVTVTNQLSNINDQFSYVLQVPCETEAAGFVVSPNTLK